MKNESHKSKIRLAKLAAAACVYAAFAICLYQPHFRKFDSLHYLVIINTYLAAFGCFILSRRWIGSFTGSFFAGAVYGFGPFSLWLSGYHAAVSLLVATIPWLLCPAVFFPKRKWWISMPLSALPFLAILLTFQIAARYRLFPIPIYTSLHLADLTGLFAPLVALERSTPLVGFYHVSIAALLLGFSMLLKARRFGILLILATGVVLACFGPFFDISPILWLTIPVLCCSVVIGAGLQGLALAGFADRKWLLIITSIMTALAVAALLLATKYHNIFAGFGTKYANLLTLTAKLYLLGAISIGIVFFIVRAKLRLAAVRWLILGSATAVDIFFGARFVVDTIF